jgi:hypothetical protein
MPKKGQKGRYTYGRRFKDDTINRMVMYRYLDKKKSTKTLVDARTKKVIERGHRDGKRRYK